VTAVQRSRYPDIIGHSVSTSVCVSDDCSGICTVAESVRHVNDSTRVTADFTPTPRRMKRRSSTSMVRRASSIRKTTSGWRDIIGSVVCWMMLYVHIRQSAYTCQAQVHGANQSRPRYVLCYLCEKILVISVIVIGFVNLVLICLYNVIDLCIFVIYIFRILRLDRW